MTQQLYKASEYGLLMDRWFPATTVYKRTAGYLVIFIITYTNNLY